MSITWYSLKKPISSIRVPSRPGGQMFDLLVWMGGQMSGGLIVKEGEVQPLVDLFIDWRNPVVVEYDDGEGHQVRWMSGNEKFHGQVVSEEYMTTTVNKEDYILERAERLWKLR